MRLNTNLGITILHDLTVFSQKELLLSILPEHTAEKMEKDIRSMIEIIRKEENKYVANLNSIM